MPRIRKPSPALVVAIVALVAALGGVAVASPLGSDGKVHLCYSQAALDDPGNGSSAVYVVNAGHACDGDYPDALTINQTGPRGLPGPMGLPGQQGPQGLPGPAGPPTSGLGRKVKNHSLGDLKDVDKANGKTEDKIRDAAKRLQALLHAHGQVDPDKLAKEQQRLLALLAAVAHATQQINDVNQTVISKLAH